MNASRVAILVAAVVAGCAPLPGRSPAPLAASARLPYRVSLEVTSALPDAYYVMSGPGLSYERFRFNDQLRVALSEYVGRTADPASARAAVLAVHIESLRTGYVEEGRYEPGPSRGRTRFASGRADEAQGMGGVVPAAAMGEDSHIPTKITKSARLTVTAELREPEGAQRRETFTEEVSEVILRRQHNPWVYGYSELLEELIRRTVARLDAFLSGRPVRPTSPFLRPPAPG
ncbi:MAG: hypothetical protein HY900_17535 [Deltaproteobacteria bacterium]|nr:hypothetical protein [Deltaproteobacteria bacterium]